MDRIAMGMPSEKRRFIIVPNVEHMLFLIKKGDLATKSLFDHIPKAKGCIAGSPGRQVWAICVWDPTPLVQKAIVQTGLEHRISGLDDQITSGRWYDADGSVGATPE
ncbi:hypothetical protein NW766_003512 [Fusarium irregulare]|uniref:LYC1 C-terminal domain-containing protein n=1 Tax=Fusarium irregulare TaxID=2494466 RepID=A0A9W8UDP4_9HYPO|nr:hypothetical protein NW766_003512 [Fusarium irregulare]